jgi:ABC-type transport system involved in multi-copper enzyme maturation permease subunit
MNPLWTKQIMAVLRLEIKKSFFARRGLWIYLLAAIPLLIWGARAIQLQYKTQRIRDTVSQGATREKLLSIKPGLTREQVLDILPSPSHRSSFRRGDGVRRERFVFSDGALQINVTFEEDKVVRVSTDYGTADVTEDTLVFAGIFQFFYMRLAIFFGCMFVFMNLFRGEMLDRSLHYYFLAPMRRDVLVIGKYLAGLVATVGIFCTSTAMQWWMLTLNFAPQGRAEYLDNGNGYGHLFAYLGVTALACLGYGSVFLAAGIVIRNPLVTAATVLLWESINGILPATLRKISVIYYLKSLCPVEIPMQKGVPPPIAMLALNVDGATPVVAILGLLALSAVVVFIATQRIKRMEINYSTDQ